MNENPYLPPATAIVPEVAPNLWKTFARIALCLHGFAYGSMIVYDCVGGEYDMIKLVDMSKLEWVKLGVVALVELLSLYGILALVFPWFRHPALYPIWRVFVWLLPPITIVDAIYEIATDTADADELFTYLFILLPIVLIICAPVFICNFLLVSRLKSMQESNRATVSDLAL